MRREHDFDDVGIGVVIIALFLMMFVVVSMASGHRETTGFERLYGAEAPERTVAVGILALEPDIRVNQLPQVD